MISANLHALHPAYAQIFMQCKTISCYCSLNLGGFSQLDHFTWLLLGEDPTQTLKAQRKGVQTLILHIFVG